MSTTPSSTSAAPVHDLPGATIEATDEPVSRPDLVQMAVLWLPAVLFGAVLFYVVKSSAVPLTNTDTYFHLRFGAEFLHGNWSLWHPGSVTPYATSSWVPTQWLPEVVMAQLESWFGLAGVAWLSGLQQLGLICTLYVVCRRWADPLLVTFLLVPTIAGASIGLSMRPQVLSYLLIAVTVGAWLRTWDDGRLRWWLVPLTWLWAMLHGMWPIGIGLGLVAVLGLALDRRADRRALAQALLIPAASAVAAALTPVGPALYAGVLGVGDRAQFFSEWKSPAYTAVPICLALIGMLAICAVLMIRGPRASWTDIAFLLVAGGCSLWSYRTVPVGAVIVMPLVARAARPLRKHQPVPMARRERIAVLASSVVALALLAVVVPYTSENPPAQPAWLDPTLSALPAGTPVMSDWAYAGYLMWKYPHLALVAHGYGDTFTMSELKRNDAILSLAPGWDTALRSTHTRTVLVPPTYRLAYALQHQEGWHVVDRSPSLELLTAPHGWATSSS